MEKLKLENLNNHGLPDEYRKHELLGVSETQKFKEYVQLDLSLFKELLESDTEFFDLIVNSLEQESFKNHIKNEEMSLKFFQKIRMLEGVRDLIDSTTNRVMKIGASQHVKKLYHKKKKLQTQLVVSNIRLVISIVRNIKVIVKIWIMLIWYKRVYLE